MPDVVIPIFLWGNKQTESPVNGTGLFISNIEASRRPMDGDIRSFLGSLTGDVTPRRHSQPSSGPQKEVWLIAEVHRSDGFR